MYDELDIFAGDEELNALEQKGLELMSDAQDDDILNIEKEFEALLDASEEAVDLASIELELEGLDENEFEIETTDLELEGLHENEFELETADLELHGLGDEVVLELETAELDLLGLGDEYDLDLCYLTDLGDEGLGEEYEIEPMKLGLEEYENIDLNVAELELEAVAENSSANIDALLNLLKDNSGLKATLSY